MLQLFWTEEKLWKSKILLYVIIIIVNINDNSNCLSICLWGHITLNLWKARHYIYIYIYINSSAILDISKLPAMKFYREWAYNFWNGWWEIGYNITVFDSICRFHPFKIIDTMIMTKIKIFYIENKLYFCISKLSPYVLLHDPYFVAIRSPNIG